MFAKLKTKNEKIINLAEARAKSIQRMAQANYEYMIQRWTDYFETVDMFKDITINPRQQAENFVEALKKNGYLDSMNLFKNSAEIFVLG